MALDLIKEYLVGIGFDIDLNSLNTAEQSINSADRTIKNFNNNSNKGFSESFDSMKDLFSLFNSSTGVIGKLFPELQTPFKNLIGDISTVKKLYKDLTKSEPPIKDSKNNKNQKEPPKKNNDNHHPKEPKQHNTKDNNVNDNTSEALNPMEELMTKIVDKTKEMSETSTISIKDMLSSMSELSSSGGGFLSSFSISAVASFAAIGTGIAAALLAIKGLIKFISDLAQQDIGYEKLSRQLWTTKENAKEVDMALKTMGATMQDLWLSPTLMKQFTQLRKDSAALRLPKEYTDNLKVVQELGLEFSRLKQLGSLAFQWIGNYILKYLSGPILEIKQEFKSINDSLVKNIPSIAKVIGTTIGVVVRILYTVIKAVVVVYSVIFKVYGLVGKLLSMIPAPLQKIMKIIAIIGLLIMAGPVGAVIALIAALDDLFTFMRGGKSVIGSFFEGLFGGKQNKDSLSNVGTKVKDYSNNTKINTVPSSYATNNTSNSNTNTTSNSNNKISTANTFNVYGGKDANSTANVVSNKVNGLNTRNMQGVFG